MINLAELLLIDFGKKVKKGKHKAKPLPLKSCLKDQKGKKIFEEELLKLLKPEKETSQKLDTKVSQRNSLHLKELVKPAKKTEKKEENLSLPLTFVEGGKVVPKEVLKEKADTKSVKVKSDKVKSASERIKLEKTEQNTVFFGKEENKKVQKKQEKESGTLTLKAGNEEKFEKEGKHKVDQSKIISEPAVKKPKAVKKSQKTKAVSSLNLKKNEEITRDIKFSKEVSERAEVKSHSPVRERSFQQDTSNSGTSALVQNDQREHSRTNESGFHQNRTTQQVPFKTEVPNQFEIALKDVSIKGLVHSAKNFTFNINFSEPSFLETFSPEEIKEVLEELEIEGKLILKVRGKTVYSTKVKKRRDTLELKV